MDRKMKTGQVAIEFFIFMTIAILVSFIFLTLIAEDLSDEKDIEKKELLKDVVYHVRNEINLAHTVENGYYREFTVPEFLHQYDYEIMRRQDELIASIDPFSYSVIIPNITGSITKGTNKLRKQDDIVYLN